MPLPLAPGAAGAAALPESERDEADGGAEEEDGKDGRDVDGGGGGRSDHARGGFSLQPPLQILAAWTVEDKYQPERSYIHSLVVHTISILHASRPRDKDERRDEDRPDRDPALRGGGRVSVEGPHLSALVLPPPAHAPGRALHQQAEVQLLATRQLVQDLVPIVV